MNPAPAQCLGDVVQLEPIGAGMFRSRFNIANLGGEVFGGQYLGQSLWAALHETSGYIPHSMFGTFLRPADAAHGLDFEVLPIRQGRRLAQLQVLVRQSGKDLFRAEVSLFRPNPGQVQHQRPMPDAPDPRSLQSLQSLAIEHQDFLGTNAVERLLKERYFETFPVLPEIGMGEVADRPHGLYWVRAKVAPPLPAENHYAALAYLTDNMANMASRAMYVANAYDAAMGALSLNHCIWFHYPARVDQWLLWEVESPFANGGIGSNRGYIHDEQGNLQASFSQEALIEYP